MVDRIPEWAKAEVTDKIVWTGVPFTYRADGADGQFWCGSESLGGTLEAVIFGWRVLPDTRWGFPHQTWMDVAFIDDLERPSILSLKKDGLLNLLTHFDGLERRGVFMESQRVSLELKERQNTGGEAYFVCDVGAMRTVTESDFRKIREFAKAVIFNWTLIGEVGE
jgi:hypothetical protein